MSVAITKEAPESQQSLKLSVLTSRRHPAYLGRVAHWTFCQQTYDGGRDWFDKNMHRYIKEGDREYVDRVARAYRFNHTREVVSLLTKYVFKEPVERQTDQAAECVKKFWTHSMLHGGSIDTLMKAAASQSSVTGDAWIVTDTTAENSGKVSVSNETGRVFAFIVKPQDMLDFAFGDDGKPSWILYQFNHRDDTDPLNSSGEMSRRFVLWTKTKFYVIEETLEVQETQPQNIVTSASISSVNQSAEPKKKYTLVNEGVNAIGAIPAVRVPHTDTGDVYVKTGLIDDVAYLDRATANYCSNLDAIIQDQTFSQLVLPSDGLASAGNGTEQDMERKLIDMGTKSIFTYSSTATAPPKFISPDATQARIIIEVMQTLINEIYHSIGLAGERTKQDNSMGIDNSSGVAKAYDFDRLNAMLCSKAKRLEEVENELVNLVLLWNGKPVISSVDTEDNLLVKYPESYDVRGLPDEFDIAQNLMVIDAPDSIRQQQMKSLMFKLFPRIASELRKEMIKDIDSWPMSAVEQAQEMMRITAQNGSVKPVIRDTMQPAGQNSPQNESNPVAPGNRPQAQTTPSKRIKGEKAPGRSTQGQAGA